MREYEPATQSSTAIAQATAFTAGGGESGAFGMLDIFLFSIVNNPHDLTPVSPVDAIIVLLCFFGSPVLGVASLIVIYRSHGQLTGKGIATVSICLWVLFIAAVALHPFSRPVVRSNRMMCAQNLKQIYLALNAYYEDNHQYPPSFGSLFPKYLTSPSLRIFQCPSVKAMPMEGNFDERLCSYRCIAYPADSFQKSDGDWLIMALDKSIKNHGEGMNVVYLDGHVVFTRLETLVFLLDDMVNCTKLATATRDSARKVLKEIMTEGIVPRPSPAFKKFKQEMLPQVGRKITVVGTLTFGQHGWWVVHKNWGISFEQVSHDPHDNALWSSILDHRDRKVKAIGTLQRREVAYSGSPAMTNVIEQFYFDIAEVNLSDEDSDKNAKPPSK